MKVRQSNMELLRIIAMFLVLLVHADFFSLGAPSASDCVNAPVESSLKVFFQAIICMSFRMVWHQTHN